MYLILCVDERGGRLFNKRRQSQDRVLRERILSLSAGHTLWMSAYSAKQFTEGGTFTVDDDYLSKAGEEDYCFVENLGYDIDRCKGVILYNWNRHYPSDLRWDVDLKAQGFTLCETKEFAGHSHETITEDIYLRK